MAWQTRGRPLVKKFEFPDHVGKEQQKEGTDPLGQALGRAGGQDPMPSGAGGREGSSSRQSPWRPDSRQARAASLAPWLSPLGPPLWPAEQEWPLPPQPARPGAGGADLVSGF